MDIKKLCEYPYNGYSTDMGTGTEKIFTRWHPYLWLRAYTCYDIVNLLANVPIRFK